MGEVVGLGEKTTLPFCHPHTPLGFPRWRCPSRLGAPETADAGCCGWYPVWQSTPSVPGQLFTKGASHLIPPHPGSWCGHGSYQFELSMSRSFGNRNRGWAVEREDKDAYESILVGSPPQEPTGEEARPPARDSKPALFLPIPLGLLPQACVWATLARFRALWVRGPGSRVGSLSSKLYCHAFLRSKGPQKGPPACRCLPYLARLSHGAVMTLSLSRNVPFSRAAGQREVPWRGGSHEPMGNLG